MTVRILTGDALDVLRTLDAGSCASLVTDPPAGIAFMGAEWDKHRGGRAQWIAWLAEILTEARRVLVPGAHALVWALPRTSHWTATAVEDAGFQVRDVVVHLQGQGFPKSKSLLKPAAEHWILARAPGPLRELGIDACRIGTQGGTRGSEYSGGNGTWAGTGIGGRATIEQLDSGRWPANVVLSCDCDGEHDGCPVAELDAQSGTTKSSDAVRHNGAFKSVAKGAETARDSNGFADTGGASRFFYCAKPSTAERSAGLDGKNTHPTVKPVDLMRWLVRLVTPPGGVVLDPFAGSGTTGVAALAERMRFVGIERDPGFAAFARRRIENELGPLFASTVTT